MTRPLLYLAALLAAACSVDQGPAPAVPAPWAGSTSPAPPCEPHGRDAALVCAVEAEPPPGSPGVGLPGSVLVVETVAEGLAAVEADCWTVITWSPGVDCVDDLAGYLDELEAPAGVCGCVEGERLELRIP